MTEIRIKAGIQVRKKDSDGNDVEYTPQAWTLILNEGKGPGGITYRKTDPKQVRAKLHEALDTMLDETEVIWNGK